MSTVRTRPGAVIQIGSTRVDIWYYSFRCSDPVLLAKLNKLLDPGGPGGEDPDPDHSLAVAAVMKYGGRILNERPNARPVANA